MALLTNDLKEEKRDGEAVSCMIGSTIRWWKEKCIWWYLRYVVVIFKVPYCTKSINDNALSNNVVRHRQQH